jgi:hypothetical protein
MTTAFVILNTNKVVWGREAFVTAEVAEAELRNFYKKDLRRDKFSIEPLEAKRGDLPIRTAITGDYAGMVSDEVMRKYPAPKKSA